MKIGKSSDIAAVSTTPNATQAAASRGAARAATPSAPGRARAESGVTVSVRAHALVQTDLSAGDDIDMNKVEAVRAAIQQGTFKINPEVIADKLLANAKDMLARA